MLVVLAWSNLAFCGEIQDAARSVTWKRSRRCSKTIPIWFPAKMTNTAGRLARGDAEWTQGRGGIPVGQQSCVNAMTRTAMHLCTWRRLKDKRRWRFCCWPIKRHQCRDKSGMTPLHMAASQGNKEVAVLLLAIKRRQRQGQRRRDGFAHGGGCGSQGCGKIAAGQQGRCQCQDNKGYTPLGAAVANGHKDVAELLRQHGGQE